MVKAARSANRGSVPVADGFFVLRTPLLPAATLIPFAADNGIATATALDDREFEYWVAQERNREREVLRAILDRPAVRAALFVASPSLVDSLRGWRAAPDAPHGRASEAALVRYVQRMSARPTPFGLFAGTTLGTTGDHTALALAPQRAYRRHTRIDGDYLDALTEALSRDPALRPHLAFEPNTSIYRVADRIRYIERRRTGDARVYVLTAVDALPALVVALAAARGGQPLAALAAAVVASDPEIAHDEALAFVDELVDAGLLVSTLAPRVTGEEPIHAVIAELGAHPAAAALRAMQGRIEALDDAGIAQPPSAYAEAAAALRDHVALEAAPRFQVDLVKPGARVVLGGDLRAELDRGIALLARLDMSEPSEIVAAFARAFSRRFEAEEVALALALDPELGVGLGDGADEDPTSVLARQRFEALAPPAGATSSRDPQLLALLADALAHGHTAIELDEHACRALEARAPATLPACFLAAAALHAASPEDLERGDFALELMGLRGPSGVNLLGRFCHGDRALAAWVERHLRAEEAERPDAVFAEIVHWPEGKTGNVIARPVLRAHEIVFLARGGVPAERQILLDDLLVSVRGDRVVLRSRRLDREVIPRLTSAHMTFHARNATAYRLLGELAGQGRSGALGWSWGGLRAAPFLPRVSCGRIILSLAHWNLAPEQVAALVAPATSTARLRAVDRLRDELGLPRHLALLAGDRRMPIDLHSVLSVEAFLHAVRGPAPVILSEHPAAHGGAASGPEGAYRAELFVPFRAAPAEAPRRAPRPPAPRPSPEDHRVFPPGSEWLYLQLHAGISTIDRAIIRLAPVLASERAAGRIDRWFFVRYRDPDWHLRLRVHGPPAALWGEVRGALQPVLDDLMIAHGVHRITYDTYRRETERYGGAAGIELAERIFHVDSAAVAACLVALLGDDRAADRFQLALTSTDLLLSALLPDAAARQAMIERTRAALVEGDLGRGVEVARWLGGYARRERAALASVGQLDPPADAPLAGALAILRAHGPALTTLGDELRGLERDGRLAASAADVSQSLVHMHLNRLFRGDQRRQEAVVYDLLARVYRSRRARARSVSPSPSA